MMKLQSIMEQVSNNTLIVASASTELSAVSAQISVNTEKMSKQTTSVATATERNHTGDCGKHKRGNRRFAKNCSKRNGIGSGIKRSIRGNHWRG
jgi:hypothetical protein